MVDVEGGVEGGLTTMGGAVDGGVMIVGLSWTTVVFSGGVDTSTLGVG